MNIVYTIVVRVRKLEQTKPLNLQPLHEAIALEALERVLESVEGPFEVQFTYCGYMVTALFRRYRECRLVVLLEELNRSINSSLPDLVPWTKAVADELHRV